MIAGNSFAIPHHKRKHIPLLTQNIAVRPLPYPGNQGCCYSYVIYSRSANLFLPKNSQTGW